MSHTRRKYDPEFRAGAVRIVRETRRPVVEIARDLGIGAGTLGNWVRKDRIERGWAEGLSSVATDAVNMAAAVRGGAVAGVIFHTDKGSQYTSDAFAAACAKLKITQSMRRVGCALDNAAAESFFSTLQHELISRRRWRTRDQPRRDIAVWIDTWYNRKRLHSTNNMTSPIDYELANAA